MIRTSVEWIKEKEELSDSGAHIERVEGFFQAIQLWECGNQL